MGRKRRSKMKTMKKMMTLLAVAGLGLALAGSAHGAGSLIDYTFTADGADSASYGSDGYANFETGEDIVTWSLAGWDVTMSDNFGFNGNGSMTISGPGTFIATHGENRFGTGISTDFFTMNIVNGATVSFTSNIRERMGNGAFHLSGIGSTLIAPTISDALYTWDSVNEWLIAYLQIVGGGTSDGFMPVTVTGGTLQVSVDGGRTTFTVAGPAGTVIIVK
jgi:hypothetical protein